MIFTQTVAYSCVKKTYNHSLSSYSLDKHRVMYHFYYNFAGIFKSYKV